MDELISRITSNVGIDAATAEKSVGLILSFLQQEGDEAAASEMINGTPGGPEVVAKHGEPMSGGVMGLGGKLMGAGLGMGEINGVAREVMSFAKEKVGAETVDRVVGSVPGLSQFV